MRFLLYVGENRVGKSTMSKSIQDLVHRGCKCRAMRMSFSDSLRNELVTFYGLPANIVYDTSIDKNNTILRLGDYQYHKSIPKLWKRYKLIERVSCFDDLHVSLRDILINHGTHIRRSENPHYWTEQIDKKVIEAKGNCDLIIIDDARHPDDFGYFDIEKTLIYHLTNGKENVSDISQDEVNRWIRKNPDRIEGEIKLPVPLLQYFADQINTARVIPKIIPKRNKPKRFV